MSQKAYKKAMEMFTAWAEIARVKWDPPAMEGDDHAAHFERCYYTYLQGIDKSQHFPLYLLTLLKVSHIGVKLLERDTLRRKDIRLAVNWMNKLYRSLKSLGEKQTCPVIHFFWTVLVSVSELMHLGKIVDYYHSLHRLFPDVNTFPILKGATFEYGDDDGCDVCHWAGLCQCGVCCECPDQPLAPM